MQKKLVYRDEVDDPIALPDLTDPEQTSRFLLSLPDVSDKCPSAKAQLIEVMGIRFHHLGADLMVCSMPVEGNRQTLGVLHGGANAVLGETTGSLAANYLAPEGKHAVGSNIFVTHHRPAVAGRVYCVATLAQSGRTLATYFLKIFSEDGKLTASGTHTCAFVED